MSELMGLWRKMPTKDRQWHLVTILNEAEPAEKRQYVRDLVATIPVNELIDYRLYLSDESNRREAETQMMKLTAKFRDRGMTKTPTPIDEATLATITAQHPTITTVYVWDPDVLWLDGEHVLDGGDLYRKQGPDAGDISDPRLWVHYPQPVQGA